MAILFLFQEWISEDLKLVSFGGFPPETVVTLEICFKVFYIMVYDMYLP